MTSRPHVFSVSSSDDRRLAAALVSRPYTSAVELTGKGLQVRTSDFGAFCAQIAPVAREHGITLRATLGRRRAFLFAIPAMILIVVTLVLRASHPAGPSWQGQVLGDFGFSVLLPLTALIIWEGLLANTVGGVRILSIAHYSLGVANAIDPDPNLRAGLGIATSVILGVIVTIGALVLATRRLAAFAIKGEPA